MTYLPHTHQGFHLPPALGHFLLLLCALIVPVVVWIAFDRGSTSDESSTAAVAESEVDASSLRNVAYILPGTFSDEVWVRPLESSVGRQVATISHIFATDGAGSHGTASPLGNLLAVLAVAQDDEFESPYLQATLHLVPLTESTGVMAAGQFDPLSRMAWSADGSVVVLSRSGPADEAGKRSVSLVEVDVATGDERDVALLDDVLEFAPIGYTADGALLAVSIDASGSQLWAIADGSPELVGSLSAGKTRDWSLSPDRSRLAYVEVLSAADRAYAGRTFLLAAGRVVETELPGNQLGAAWRPGIGTPDFGSQEGTTWVLDPPPEEPVFIVPMGWAPDGSALVASIHTIVDGRVSPEGTLQIAWPDRRVSLEEGARFLGFVVDD